MMESSLNPTMLGKQRACLQWQQQQQGYCVERLVTLQTNECIGSDHGWPSQYTNNVGEEEIVTPPPTLRVANESKATKKRKVDKSPMGEGEEQASKRYGTKRREASGESPKEKEEKKMDYIHVRARRGQATDSHSLAERVSSDIIVNTKFIMKQ